MTIRLLERIVAERGLTLLFTEHDMEVVFSIAQKIAVLHQGRLIAEGAPDEVRDDPEVRRVYLGEQRALTPARAPRRPRRLRPSRVLFGVSLTVAPGECVCLLGRNGVGKTTTMRSIMGLTPPSAGRVAVEGAGHHRLRAVPHRPRRHRLRAGGPPHLRRADGAGEPRSRRRAPPAGRARGTSTRSTACSPSCASWPTARAGSCPAASSRC